MKGWQLYWLCLLLQYHLAESAMKRFFYNSDSLINCLSLHNCGFFALNYQDLGNFVFLLYIFLLYLYWVMNGLFQN